MTDPPRDPQDTDPDAELRALFARTAPAPRPTDLAPLRAAVAADRPSPASRPPSRRTAPMKFAAAALTALTLAVAAAAFWRATPAVAFDDVRAAVAAAGDFRVAGRLLRETEPAGGTDSRGYDQPDFIVTEVSDRRRRSEEFDVVVHPGLPAAYEDRPRARALTTTTVVDQDAGLILESNHRDRTARVKLIAENDGAAGYADDWSRYLQDLPTEDAEPLDAGMIGSIRALGFRVSDFPWFQSRQVPAHIWVDEATMLPGPNRRVLPR